MGLSNQRQSVSREAKEKIVVDLIGCYLRFNPWDDHWHEPCKKLAAAIVEKLDNLGGE